MDFKFLNNYTGSFQRVYDLVNVYIESCIRIFGIYIAWICVHYISSHLYLHWCVQSTLVGFLMSPFLVPAPHCQALRWIIYNGASNINAMWIFLSTWIINRILPFGNYADSKENSRLAEVSRMSLDINDNKQHDKMVQTENVIVTLPTEVSEETSENIYSSLQKRKFKK